MGFYARNGSRATRKASRDNRVSSVSPRIKRIYEFAWIDLQSYLIRGDTLAFLDRSLVGHGLLC